MAKRNNTVVIYIQIRDSEWDFGSLNGNKFSRAAEAPTDIDSQRRTQIATTCQVVEFS